MEWNNGTEQFENERPKPSPRINVHVELIREEYERLGVACNGTISGTFQLSLIQVVRQPLVGLKS